MTTRFLPYSCQTIDEQDIHEVVQTLNSDWITQGPTVPRFEEAFAAEVGANYAVSLANGTAALHLCNLAIDLGKDDEIITTPNTFVATPNSALYCGATPVFVDIDDDTGLIDPEDILRKITKKTKVIMPVDFSGCPANLSRIKEIADQNKCVVIQDACHSLGASFQDSKIGDCRYADLTVFSFHPVKPLTTGEGGMITTNSKDLYDKLCRLRSHGITKDPALLSENPGPWYYEMQSLGFNYRLTDFQAALGLSQLKKLTFFTKQRQKMAALYRSYFEGSTVIQSLKVPSDRKSSFHLYVIKIDFKSINKTRKDCMNYLRDQGIGTQVHYIPVYQQPYYKTILKTKPSCPKMDAYYEKALSIPLFPSMTETDIKRVSTLILDYVSR